MKKIFILIVAFTLFYPSYALAQSPPKSLIPTDKGLEKINEKVDELKDKIASRVAELNLVEKRGMIGVVQSVSDTKITITDLNKKNRIIDVDEFTKFSSGDEDDFGISDIKKGMKISVLGLYNKESARLLARFVNEVNIPLFLHGVISEKDDENFTVNLLTEDGTNYTVDIEKITKTSFYSDGKLEALGFSKIETLQNALIIGFPDPKEKDRITATRIVTFPNLPKNPKIPIIQNTTPTPSPTKESDTEN